MYIAIISFPVDEIINLKLILALKLTIINSEIKNYPRSQKKSGQKYVRRPSAGQNAETQALFGIKIILLKFFFLQKTYSLFYTILIFKELLQLVSYNNLLVIST